MTPYEEINATAEQNAMVKEYIDLHEQIKELAKEKEPILAGLPAGYLYQADDTKVWRVERPKGRFVYFPKLDVVKVTDAEAKEMGFVVERVSRKKESDK